LLAGFQRPARGYRWVEAGTYAAIEAVAEAENVNLFFGSLVLRMALFAPEIAELHPANL